ncbi:pirin family protein [Fluviispira sanaruensis]|uniref:Pirin family protein n=1 Tax=Fluviispira sanaruensis TaxID=2493639 RepID=A0A4P2VZL5_FLUSA|nr:pirin family protein [Fluviispira sanaruensis]BBH54322.1 pirin family protein [Fluviispira sanaruensis]
MLRVRKSQDRGSAEHGWLHAKHTFSFSSYYDEEHMGFRNLKVINEDIVEPAQGFPTHGHRNMEIITYVLEGALEHKDSLGTGSVIRPGEVQIMSAGKGIQHSEFNHSKENLLHLLQIWIEPSINGKEPSYAQKDFSACKEKLKLVVSPNGEEDSLSIKQDVKLYRGIFARSDNLKFTIMPSRHVWLQLASGSLTVNGQQLAQGDGLAMSDEKELLLEALEGNCSFLLFDLC